MAALGRAAEVVAPLPPAVVGDFHLAEKQKSNGRLDKGPSAPVPSIDVFVVEQVAPAKCYRDAQHAREEALLPDVRTGKRVRVRVRVGFSLSRGAPPLYQADISVINQAVPDIVYISLISA